MPNEKNYFKISAIIILTLLGEVFFNSRIVQGADFSWTKRSMPSSALWYDVAYGNGIFVAVATSSSNKAAVSTDGITWTASTLPATAGWESITYGNGTFVAIANNSSIAATSSDGVNWTQRAMPSSAAWNCLTYGNGKFVAIASSSTKAATSLDGITWTAIVLPVNRVWSSVAYGDIDDGLFVAISNNNSSVTITSPDGVTWTQRTLPVSANWRSLGYGNGKFVAGTAFSSGAAAISSDGINWTQTTMPVNYYGNSITYGNRGFVSVGGTITVTSPDGITWTQRTAPSVGYYSTTYGNGIFVAVGGPSAFAASSNGELAPITNISVSPSPVSAGSPATITVTAYDSNGDPFYSSGDATTAIDITGSNSATPAVTDNGDGTYTATYTPTTAGTDQITATINSTAIGEDSDGTSDGTFNLTVNPIASASDSNISVSPSPVSAGSPVAITVTAYDSSGNPHTEGGDTVVIDITGSNSATPSVTDNGDGTYTATYTPTTAGTDQITATINSTAIGEDSDGTSDGTFNLTVSVVPTSDPTEEDNEEEEAEEESQSTLTESEDGTLILDNNVSKGETEVEHISPEDDQGTQIKEIQLEADNNHKINGEIEIEEVKKTEVPELPEELSGHSCSVYTQIKVDADSSIDKEDVESVTFQFRISKKYKESNPDPNFFVTREKGGEVTLLEQKNNQANEITATSSWIKGTWTVLDCSKKITQPENPENEIRKTTPVAPVPESAPEDSPSSDVQNSDSDDSSKVVVTLDGDFDGSDDFLLDTDGDSRPDTYWDPDSGIFSRIEMKDIDNDSVEEYVLGEATYYDPSDKKVKLIKPSLKDQAQEILSENKVVAAGIVTTGAALPFLALPFQLNSLSDIGLLLKETFFRILGFLGWSKRKRRDWGIVYDVDSGFPIPLATIQVIDKISGKVKETRLTDSLGSYCFLVSPGTYVLASEKKEFSEFKDGDLSAVPAYYENTYRYQPLKFKDYAKINADIPMQTIQGSSIEKLQKKSVWKSLIGAIFWLGFLVNVIVFAINPNLLNGIFVLAYLGLEVMQNFGNKGPKWGTVTNAEGVLQSFVTLKLYQAENRELVARTITDEKGRYFLIANPGDYILTAKTVSGKEAEVNFSLKARNSVKERIGI